VLKRSILVAILLSLGFPGLFLGNAAYAHEFSSGESSSFLALVESIKVELGLAHDTLASNATAAAKHAEHAHEHLDQDVIEEISERNERLGRDLPAALEELHMSIGNSSSSEIEAQIQNINDLLDETVSVRIDRAEMTNSTTQAVFVANLVDGALEHYKIAHGLGSDHGDNATHDSHESEDSMSMDDDHANENETHTAQEGTIVDIVSYQTSQGLAQRAIEVFNETVRGLAPANSTEALANVETGLTRLNQSIANMSSPNDIEVIVHGQIHPSLQEAYDLQIIPEFPVPLLVGITAVAGAVAAGRLRMLRRTG
jgi:hypothetical protein